MEKEVMKKKKEKDKESSSSTSLSLTHKALSDVSNCLTQFTNLEKLDLAFNTLTSLQGLSSCLNLKWLSVVQNKLRTLDGIQSLSKLTVLNAGKNKLQSMDEITSLVNLRALILNDNEIVSISKLNQLKELNTLVLSRNPIREIGESLVIVKSLTKLSLSNCQLQTIGSSLKSCVELKELRLAHNDIKILPVELACNKKLENLDLGNNVITRWPDVKVLNSIVSLKNLNLQANPITEMDKISKKVQKSLPNLRIFNARPLDKGTKMEGSCRIDDFSIVPANNLGVSKDEQNDSAKGRGHHDRASDAKVEDLKRKNKKVEEKLSKKEDASVYEMDDIMVEKKLKRKKSLVQDESNDLYTEDLKEKRKKTNEKFLKNDVQVHEDERNKVERKFKSKKSRKFDEIDNVDTSFADFFALDATEGLEFSEGKKMLGKAGEDIKSMSGIVAVTAKGKKTRNHKMGYKVQLPAVVEVGMGGPSTWGDE